MIMQTLRMQKLLTQIHGGYRVLVCREERVKLKRVTQAPHFIHHLVGSVQYSYIIIHRGYEIK